MDIAASGEQSFPGLGNRHANNPALVSSTQCLHERLGDQAGPGSFFSLTGYVIGSQSQTRWKVLKHVLLPRHGSW